MEEGKVVEIGENQAAKQYDTGIGPNGKLIKAQGNSFLLLDHKGEKDREIEIDNLNEFVYGLNLNPEGKKLAFLDGEQGVNASSSLDGRELKVLNIEEETSQVIGDFAYYNQPVWLSDQHLATVVNAPVEDAPFKLKIFSLE